MTASWLARSPQRYPKIPTAGIKKNTLPIRSVSPNVLIKKVIVVLPRPFKMLINVVLVYKNGQIYARVRMNFPASLLWKIVLPMKFPQIKNPMVQAKPRVRQEMMT